MNKVIQFMQFGLFLMQNAYVPEGGNKGRREATFTFNFNFLFL